MIWVKDVYAAIQEVAPQALSDEFCQKYSAYDNSGILVGRNGEVKKVVASLDFSIGAVQKAINEKAELLYTHHPAIYGKISSVTEGEPLGEKLLCCIENGIGVISTHLNLDCAKEGIDEYLSRGIKKAAGSEEGKRRIFRELSQEDTGYGRGYDVPEIELEKLVTNIKKEFKTDKVLYYGSKTVKRIASFCGAGADEESVLSAVAFGADTIVSSDFKHHVVTMAREAGLNVIVLTHYAAENYGFERISKKIIEQTGLSFVYHTDEELL